MSCEVAAFPCQAHANYGTWSIDFDHFFSLLKIPVIITPLVLLGNHGVLCNLYFPRANLNVILHHLHFRTFSLMGSEFDNLAINSFLHPPPSLSFSLLLTLSLSLSHSLMQTHFHFYFNIFFKTSLYTEMSFS